MRIRPTEFFSTGITDLIPIIPTGAQMAPSSKIPQVSIGKVPGRRLDNGLYVGLNWRAYVATAESVATWERHGSGTGLRADQYPGLDIDILDEPLAQIVEDFAIAKLGLAPIRTGRAPKRLLMYRTDAPFGRMRLWVTKDKVEHLVELLGKGNQYVVDGIHPKTLQPYAWVNGDLVSQLETITHESASTFFSELKTVLEMIHGLDVRLDGDGRLRDAASTPEQTGLLAPSIELLQEAVSRIPNGEDKSRDDIVKVGHAIRAACGEDIEEGKALYVDLVTRGGHRGEIAEADYNRFRAPYTVGWSLIAEMARPYGFDWTPMEATADVPSPDDAPAPRAITRSDQWLADEILKTRSGDLRYAAEASKWYVWDGAKWAPDAVMLAEHTINMELIRIADRVVREGATPKEQKEALEDATQMCSGGKAGSVRKILASRQDIAISVSAFDSDPWKLCTPGGIVDLTTGALGPADPDALCSKSTSVTPDESSTPTRWNSFLLEACGGDPELVAYIQRWCGYVLTGSTREQAFAYLIGDGGNGKGVLFRTLARILAGYAKTATLDTFTASSGDRHSTDIAGLEGARLVTSSEAQANKAWDTQRIKSMTGGDAISARLMRENNRTYQPLYKVLFAGNQLPSLPTVDVAMKRRLQVIPFVVTPKVVDGELDLKLREEDPAILAWMIAGCLAWQRVGLTPPESVQRYTAHYFKDQDTVGRFLEERTTLGGSTSAGALFRAFQEWSNREGESKMSGKSFGSRLVARGLERTRTSAGSTYPVTLNVEDFTDDL